MKILPFTAVLFAAALLVSCTDQSRDLKSTGDSTTETQASEDNLTPAQLTGIPVLDQPPKLELTVLYARGSGLMTGMDRPLAPQDPIQTSRWVVSTPGSEFELSFRSGLITDSIIRLGPSSHFLMENPPPGSATEARFRVYTGQASFFLPPLPQNQISVITPSGTLTSPGGAFTVTISPDFQVLVTCREGMVFLTGRESAAAWPGQVFQFGPLGNNRSWTLTPNQALTFQSHWYQVMSDESTLVLEPQKALRLQEFRSVERRFRLDAAELTSLWWAAARAFLPEGTTDKDFPDAAAVASLWDRAARERSSLSPGPSAWFPPSLVGESLLGNRL